MQVHMLRAITNVGVDTGYNQAFCSELISKKRHSRKIRALVTLIHLSASQPRQARLGPTNPTRCLQVHMLRAITNVGGDSRYNPIGRAHV